MVGSAYQNCGGNSAYCNGSVYYENGQVAWDGRRDGVCYHPNGLPQGCNGVTLNQGEGIDLSASLTVDSIRVYGERILLSPPGR